MHKHVNWKKIGQAVIVFMAMVVLAVLAKHYEFPDIQVSHEEEIVIPGIEREYEFLVLADMHLVIKEREDAGAYGVSADERIAYFSNPKGTPSYKHLPQWVEYANQKNMDAVLMVGDMIDYYTAETVKFLYEQVEGFDNPYLFTLGNHELFSPWYEPIPMDSLLYDLFKEASSAFQVLEFDEFVICAIDNNEYQVNPASYESLRVYIEANSEKPIILLAHVPFYTENDRSLLEKSINTWGQALVIGEGEGTRDTTAVSREFLKMILDEESPVVAVLTGDNHFYHKGELADGVTQWVIEPAFAGNGMILRVKGN